MFDEVLKNAAELDRYMEIHKKPKDPLHGLPISVKEHIHLAGTPSTSGFIAWADDISQSDALIVKVLRDSGAIFHVKTTNPQSLMVSSTVPQRILYERFQVSPSNMAHGKYRQSRHLVISTEPPLILSTQT